MVSLVGYANSFIFIGQRRDLAKQVMFKDLRLAGDNYPLSPEWLFGGDLGESVDRILNENKLAEKMFSNNKPSKSSHKKQSQKGQKPHQGKKSKNKKGHKNLKDSINYVSPLPQRDDKPNQGV